MEKGVWFQFSNHKWNIMQKAHGLSLKISQEITIEFAVLLLEITKKMVLGKEQDRDNYQKKSNEINAVIKNLKNS